VHSGNAALEVNYQSPRVNYTGLSLTEGTTYTLTYWLESTETNAPVGVTFGTYSGSGTINDESACVTAGGYASSSTPSDPTLTGWATAPWAIWSNYSATITPTNTATNFEFGIDCRPTASDFYIDDVVLVAQGSSVNLVQDGGFENAFQSNIGGDGNDWFAANWVDQHWFGEYAFQVHQYGNPAGQQSLYIQGTPAVAAAVTLPTGPTLGIAVATNTVTISWPLASAGYVLQYNADISTTNWVNVSSTASTNASSFWITVPVGAGNAFYRLAN
jgi:hypothetical protein